MSSLLKRCKNFCKTSKKNEIFNELKDQSVLAIHYNKIYIQDVTTILEVAYIFSF